MRWKNRVVKTARESVSWVCLRADSNKRAGDCRSPQWSFAPTAHVLARFIAADGRLPCRKAVCIPLYNPANRSHAAVQYHNIKYNNTCPSILSFTWSLNLCNKQSYTGRTQASTFYLLTYSPNMYFLYLGTIGTGYITFISWTSWRNLPGHFNKTFMKFIAYCNVFCITCYNIIIETFARI